MNIASIFKESLTIYKKDKWIIFFTFIPVIIGIFLYAFIGTYLYTDVLSWGSDWIRQKITSDTFGTFIVYFMVTLLTVAFYLVLSWTFTLIVSVISSPFNDVLSRRVERVVLGQEADSIVESMSQVGRGFFGTIFNEIKKIVFILLVTILSFLISFIPLLTPVSLILSSYLMTVTFIDYIWSRKSLSVSQCLNHLRKGLIVYFISGFIFLGLVAVPFVQFLVIPLGVTFFTIMYTRRTINE